MMRIGNLLFLVLLTSPGCASALHQPPSFPRLTGGRAPRAVDEVNDLLTRAEALFGRRENQAVEEAATLWMEAAAADRSRVEGLLGAARARVWLGERLADDTVRLKSIREAIVAAQWCEETVPAEAGCAYWLGVAVGLQARERPSTGLDALPRMVALLERAASKAPRLDDAGPDRALALLYVRAPGWPTGPGDPDQGLEHAQRAVGLCPSYPPNLLALAEALAATGESEAGRETYRHALELSKKMAAEGNMEAGRWINEAETALARAAQSRFRSSQPRSFV